MENFFYSIPTKVYFGTDALDHLGETLRLYGRHVLLCYGGGSIKRAGLYDRITAVFKKDGLDWTELSGIEANPSLTTVKKGVAQVREHPADVILAVGGGSTIDCAKGVAAGCFYPNDPWNLVEDGSLIRKALPIVAVSTISATGSEMDPFGVITNEKTKEKKDLSADILYPAYAFLDPRLTYTVPPYQTACGAVDIMSHIMDVYFNGVKETFLQDRVMEALLRTCVRYGPIACREPENYDARANLMWASEWAINGFIACGKPGPWPAHSIEHQLSACYGVTHGHGLAVVIPTLMRHVLCGMSAGVFAAYGRNVFGLSGGDDAAVAKEAIDRTEALFRSMGLGLSLRDLGITGKERFEEMADKVVAEEVDQCLVPLYKKDIVEIYDQCF